jgi:hypothetical protein
VIETTTTHRTAADRSAGRRTAATVLGRRLGAAGEAALVLGALALYLTVRALTGAERGTALAHGAAVLRFERALGLAHEQGVQSWVLAHGHLTSALNTFYVWCFWPTLLAALVWLHRRSASGFVALRNALIVSGLVGLVVFALYPVAPPRMLEGFRDTVQELSRSRAVAHPSGLTNEYAALPSFHVGWTALACAAVAAELRRPLLRCLAVGPAVLMVVAVVATGNHFLVDGLAGAALTLGTWRAFRTRPARVRSARAPRRQAAAKPSRQLGWAGRQASSRLALAFDAPRTSVIITTPGSPVNIRPTNRGTCIGCLAPSSCASAGSHSATGAGSSTTTL